MSSSPTSITGLSIEFGKASLGLARDVDLAGPFAVTLGALGSVNFIPSPLADAYGKKHPLGAMAFLRFKVD